MNLYHPHSLRVCPFGPHGILLVSHQPKKEVYPELQTSTIYKNILNYKFLFMNVKIFILSTPREYNILLLFVKLC